MSKKRKISFLVLSLFLFLLFWTTLHAEPLNVTENLRGGTVLLPSSAPDEGRLIMVSFVTITLDEEVIGELVLYDDPQTRRSVDYWELYDGSGGLLLVGWVDRFGIRRIAVDHGLLQEGISKLEGVLVLLREGTQV